MSRLSIWNSGKKTSDFRFIDRIVSEYFGIGGTGAFIHLYNGVYEQSTPTLNADGTTTPGLAANATSSQPTGNVTSIQDVLFLENRDRAYDPNVYELRTIYNVGDADFDLKQFGFFLTGDNLFLEFHYNDMLAGLGRKLMVGDVIELPHKRDEFLLNGAPAINAFYTVQDASWASDGYSVTWWQHIWRVKVSPMTASQEFSDILSQQAVNPLGLPMTNADGSPATLAQLMSDAGSAMNIDQAVVDDAIANFKDRNFETQQFWYVPGTTGPDGKSNPWVWAGDGIPPDGANLVGQGNAFPISPSNGDYYLRKDYHPPVLFQFQSSVWKRQEIAWRQEWSPAHRLLKEFINDRSIACQDDGEKTPTKVNMSKVVTRPVVDF